MPNIQNEINLYYVAAKDLNKLQDHNLGRCLIVTVDENQHVQDVSYQDMFGSQSIDPRTISITKLRELAEAKAVNLSLDKIHLIHLTTEEIPKLMSTREDSIRTADEMISKYFTDNPTNHKLSRKQSGLSHSYFKDSHGDIIQLANKQECRVVWLDEPPTAQIFANLPTNTSGVYALVKAKFHRGYDLHYITKTSSAAAAEPDTLKKRNLTDLTIFEPFKLSNRALSKDELIRISTYYEHIADSTNVYGSGGFGRVKKAKTMESIGDSHPKAIKIQTFKTAKTKVKTKLENSSAELAAFKKEAAITADLNAGDEGLLVENKKSYLQMEVLGEPVANVLPSSSMEDKVDLAIKFLMAVYRMHSGEAAKSGTRYAHRDIKLANILVSRESGEVRLIDFGLTTTNVQTKDELFGGTIFYAPLDQSVINRHLQKTYRDKSASSGSSEEYSLDSQVSFLDDSDDSKSKGFGDSAIHIAAGNQNLDWKFNLKNPEMCLTVNYLEDDKIAALRTIYCDPTPKDPNLVLSIFDTSDFTSLPLPIQQIFDSSTIAPLLTDERRKENMGFFAAVMIAYKNNPNLSDEEYENLITNIRLSSDMQESLIKSYNDAANPAASLDTTEATKEVSTHRTATNFSISRNMHRFLGFFTGKSNRSVVPMDYKDEEENDDEDKKTNKKT